MKSFLTLLTLVFSTALFAQNGKIVLVGGGAESDADYGWSNAPYQWAVDQSSNKKVAIITYQEGATTDWQPNYFESLGATEATNFEIYTSAMADDQDTYDDLMAYDVFFFKGGDQYQYYDLYQNSKVSEAIEDKFAAGGVIMGTSAGMAILSKVFYSAASSSVYPDEALNDVYYDKLTLENDFLDILDGVIVDTHFAERGRFPRLLAFMGNWKLNHDEMPAGIGVDDKTALCIDENGQATAYGTGAVSIYHMTAFEDDEGRPQSSDINVTHLLHDRSYDLNEDELIDDYAVTSSATVGGESLRNTLTLSGSDALSHNEDWLDEIIENTEGSVVLVSKPGSSLVSGYESYLTSNSQLEIVEVEAVQQSDCDGVTIRNQIRSARTFIVLDLDTDTFMDFFTDDKTGELLLSQMKRSDSHTVFVGESAALAGAYYCTNNLTDELNAYYGDLAFEEGLGILQSTIIMANTFDPSSSTYYENNVAAVQYPMVDKRLKYGLYLNERTHVTIDQVEGKNTLSSSGTYASILVTNTSSKGDIADQQVNSSGDTRNAVGFDQMSYSLVSGQEIEIGTESDDEDQGLTYELQAPQGLAAERQTAGIELSWTNPAGSIDQINIFRQVGSGDFELLTSLNDESESYEDNETAEDQSYAYQLEVVAGTETSCLTEAVQVEVILHAQPTKKSGFTVYPNPVKNGFLQLESDQKNHNLSLKVLDLSGKVLLDRNRWFPDRKLDLTSLQNGSYLLYVMGSNDFEIHKILIDHE